MNMQNGTASDIIKDTDEANFMADVIEASKTTPVLVDFWAPWCGPCKTLMPVLERVVAAEGGKVKLVKINIDDNQQIASQMRVQSVPAVFAFVDGQPVDGFMGAQPESELKKFVGKFTGATDVVAEADKLVARAKDSLEAGDMGGAAQDFATALQMNPECAPALAGLARVSIDNDDEEGARALLAQMTPEMESHPDIVSLKASLSLTESTPEPEAPQIDFAGMEANVKAKPDDLDARFELAKAYAGDGKNAKAVEHLLTSIAKNRAHDDEAARMFLLTIFTAEGVESDIAIDGRKRLSSILFS